ncbi:MAG: hypothetical protein K0U64_04880 [Actinomycetia bacterium]|nr:hypothetical protein [Actinomycetes bacterium]
MSPDSWLPPRGVLLHIGPRKTGTTALQSAIAAARPELRQQGIIYPGKVAQHIQAAGAVQQRSLIGMARGEKADMSVWDDLVAEVAERDDKAIVSSENFGSAVPEIIPKIINDLGGPQVKVLITIRPIGEMLPSLWQQKIKGGQTIRFDDWLAKQLKGNFKQEMWHAQRHDQLVQRWVDVAGADSVAVMPVISARRDDLYRNFEELVGITPGLLKPTRSNRSLTASEAELLRELHERIDLQRTDPQLYHRWVRQGAFKSLVERRTPSKDDPKVVLPRWAAERALEIEEMMLPGIANSGAHIVGDLNDLIPALPQVDEAAEIVAPPTSVDNDVAIELFVGLLEKANKQSQRDAKKSRRRLRKSKGNMTKMSTAEMVSEIARRGKAKATSVVKKD